MTATATQQANLAMVEGVLSLYARRGVEPLLARFEEFFTEDFVWDSTVSVGGAAWRGRAGWEAWGREVFESFESMDIRDFRHEPVGEDAVLSLGHMRIVGRDSQMELDSEVGILWRFRDGRISEGHTQLSHDAARAEAGHAA